MDTKEKRESTARLISRLLDEDTLTPEERTQLNNTLLEEPAARRLYMHYIDMQLEFACLTEPETISEQQISELVKDNAAPLAASVAAEKDDSNWSRDAIKTKRKRWPEFAAAAAAAIFIISYAINNVQRDATQPTVGQVENATGQVKFGNANDTAEATPGVPVKADQTLVTRGDKSSAVFVFDDGTSLVVAGDTEIATIDGAKHIQVTNGAVAASVSPQPVGKPLIVSTPTAEIRVVGTRFSVNHNDHLTDLAVTQGAVIITRQSDGSSLKVTAGKRVFVTSNGQLKLQNLPTLATSWRADFENGQLHPNSRNGHPTTDGLPGQSKGALRAERTETASQPGKFVEQASFASPWAEGLIIARDNTHLHLRYRLEKPTQLQIQIDTRTDGPKPRLASYTYDKFTTPSPNQWTDTSIPLSLFQNINAPDDKTLAGEIPLRLTVVAPKDSSGLLIDEIRLDRTGTGNFQSTPTD